jgi:DNA-binding PadR family transcriptional regulator
VPYSGGVAIRADNTDPGAARDLSLSEWVVLSLIAEGPTHGFAVAALTAESGDLGRIWQIQRPIVYRAITRLTEAGLVRATRTEPGDRGPQRTVLATEPAGNDAVAHWLMRPVPHVRDVRAELLAKLALLDRRGLDPGALLEAQRLALQPIASSLVQKRRTAEGFDRVLASWRAENADAALRFIDDLLGTEATR